MNIAATLTLTKTSMVTCMKKPRPKAVMQETVKISAPSLSRWLDRLMSMTMHRAVTILPIHKLIVYESLFFGEQTDATIPIQVENLLS